MTRILFTGYAPVHFVCFQPMFERLLAEPGVEVLVSGGLHVTDDSGLTRHDTGALYAPFDVPAQSLVDAADLADLDVDLLVCASTKSLRPRSHAESVQIFHGMSFRNRAIRGQNGGYDHFMLLGPYMRRAFARRGILSSVDPRVATIGFPKTDRLVRNAPDKSTVRRALGLTGDRPVVLFAPTGAHGNALELFGEDVIARFTAGAEYDLLVKPHDHAKSAIDWAARLQQLENEHVRLVRDFDAVPAMLAADVMISDASSIANEYLLLDRPLIFLDVPALLSAAEAEDDRLDLDTWGRKGGTIVRDAVEAQRAVGAALANPGAQSVMRGDMVQDLFYNPGTATDAAMAWFRKHWLTAA